MQGKLLNIMGLNNRWDPSDDLPQIDSQNWLDYKDVYFKAWNQFEGGSFFY